MSLSINFRGDGMNETYDYETEKRALVEKMNKPFTMQNTDGFTEDDLDLLNEAALTLIEAGWEKSNACDLINNNWIVGGLNTVSTLTKMPIKRIA